MTVSLVSLAPALLMAGTACPQQKNYVDASAQTKPMNVIMFLVDDMGYGDLGYLGNNVVESPNIDNFATTSANFTCGYAAPESSPTRASLLTGKNPARLHITTWIPQPDGKAYKAAAYKGWKMPNEAEGVPQSEYLLSEALRDNGYATCHIGKWHIGEGDMAPKNQGFDSDIGFWPWSYPKSYFSPYGLPTLSDGPKGEYLTDRLTDEAINFIKGKHDKPFFLNFWHYAVHEPLRAKQEDIDYYLSKGAPEEGTDRALYSAMKHSVDRSFGALLRAVDEAGIADNTIIIFFTDNGGVTKHANNGGLRQGKKFLYEGGIHVPMIVRDPRVKNASKIDVPVSSIDFYPTILDMVGIEPASVPQKFDGVSFAPLLHGEQIADRALFWHEMGAFGHGPATAMRQGKYKLLKFYTKVENCFELYDLSTDPSESNNLADKHPDIVKQMDKQIQTWIKDNKAQLPIKN